MLTVLQVYRPYSELSLINILRREYSVQSVPNLLFSGLPSAMAYQITDWAGFIIVDVLLEEDENGETPMKSWIRQSGQAM